MIKNCVICGGKFNAQGSTKTCCVLHSAELKRYRPKRYRKRHPPLNKIENCVICEAEFMKHGNQITCSSKCSCHRKRDRTKRWGTKNQQRSREKQQRYRLKNKEKMRNERLEMRAVYNAFKQLEQSLEKTP